MAAFWKFRGVYNFLAWLHVRRLFLGTRTQKEGGRRERAHTDLTEPGIHFRRHSSGGLALPSLLWIASRGLHKGNLIPTSLRVPLDSNRVHTSAWGLENHAGLLGLIPIV